MIDLSNIDIEPCNDYYRSFLHFWYGMDLTRQGSNKPLDHSCSAYHHASVLFREFDNMNLEEMSWTWLCDFALHTKRHLVCLQIICFMLEYKIYDKEYKDILTGLAPAFHKVCATERVARLHRLFCYDDLPFLVLDFRIVKQKEACRIFILKTKWSGYMDELKGFIKGHYIADFYIHVETLSKSLDDYPYSITDYHDFSAQTFWHQVSKRILFSDEKEESFYLQFVIAFYRYLVQKYPDHDFFRNSNTVSIGFILAPNARRYVKEQYNIVHIGSQTDFKNNPKHVFLLGNGIERLSTKIEKDSILSLNIEGIRIGPYVELVDALCSQLPASKLLSRLISCDITKWLRCIEALYEFKTNISDEVNPFVLSYSDALFLRNHIESESADLSRQNNRLGSLRKIFSSLLDIGIISVETNAIEMFSLNEKRRGSPAKTIPDEDLVKLISEIKDRALKEERYFCVYVILHILLETPLRESAACHLNVECIRTSLQTNRYEIVSRSKTSHGREEAYIISSELMSLITAYQKKTERFRNTLPLNIREYLFVYENLPGHTLKHSNMTSNTFYQLLKRSIEATGLPHYSAQNIRDTHMNKADLYNVMKKGSDLALSVLTGHKSVETTRRHYIEYGLRQYMECMYNVDFDAVNQAFKGYDLLDNVKPTIPVGTDPTTDSVVNGCGFCTCDDCHNPPEMDCFVCRHFICTPAEESFFKKEIENIDLLCQTSEIPFHEKETMNLKKTVLTMYLAGIYQMGNDKNGGNG